MKTGGIRKAVTRPQCCSHYITITKKIFINRSGYADCVFERSIEKVVPLKSISLVADSEWVPLGMPKEGETMAAFGSLAWSGTSEKMACPSPREGVAVHRSTYSAPASGPVWVDDKGYTMENEHFAKKTIEIRPQTRYNTTLLCPKLNVGVCSTQLLIVIPFHVEILEITWRC